MSLFDELPEMRWEEPDADPAADIIAFRDWCAHQYEARYGPTSSTHLPQCVYMGNGEWFCHENCPAQGPESA
jgi:hypothetical protein